MILCSVPSDPSRGLPGHVWLLQLGISLPYTFCHVFTMAHHLHLTFRQIPSKSCCVGSPEEDVCSPLAEIRGERALPVSNHFKWKSSDVPGGPVVEDPPCNAGDADLIPGATGELSPCAPTTEPVCRAGAVERSIAMRRPWAATREEPPITTTRELPALTTRKGSLLITTRARPRRAVKTQCSQG